MEKPTISISIVAQTDVGMERQHNEDNFMLSPNLETEGADKWKLDYNQASYSVGKQGTLLVVADGMGGTNAGEVASKIAVDTVKHFFDNLDNLATSETLARQQLIDAIHAANQAIVKRAKTDSSTEGMGTTLIIGWIIGNRLLTAWVGDSRTYISKDNNGLKQISEDHSLVQELVNRGDITMEQAFFHPQSNVITQSLGDSQAPINPGFCAVTLDKGDRIMLCSDGLNGMLQDEQIAVLMNGTPDIKSCVNALIHAANEAGGYDNITIVLCDVQNHPPAFLSPEEYPAHPEEYPAHPEVRGGLIETIRKKVLPILLVILGLLGAYYIYNLTSGGPMPVEDGGAIVDTLAMDSINAASNDTITDGNTSNAPKNEEQVNEEQVTEKEETQKQDNQSPESDEEKLKEAQKPPKGPPLPPTDSGVKTDTTTNEQRDDRLNIDKVGEILGRLQNVTQLNPIGEGDSLINKRPLLIQSLKDAVTNDNDICETAEELIRSSQKEINKNSINPILKELCAELKEECPNLKIWMTLKEQ